MDIQEKKEPTQSKPIEQPKPTDPKKELVDLDQVVAGCQDYDPVTWARIRYICDVVRECAKKNSIMEIETPTMEYRKLLLDKYGSEAEDKLIFDMADGQSALRYDLTVPFTRYVKNKGLEACRKLQIGRVYRRDTPYPTKGRFCEFYQADIDIVGPRQEMLPEAEILKIINQVMKGINIPNYVIKINFRQNLEMIFKKVGIKASNKYFKSLCTSIDKLDKRDWTYVAEELKTKKVTQEQCDELKKLFDENYVDDKVKPIYELLDKYLKIFQVTNVVFDTTLARGLDYYTGLIYEVVCSDTEIGSVVAGGRYDKLISKTVKKNKVYIPAIGVSFGVSRLALLMPEIKPDLGFRVYIVAETKLLDKKLEIANMLWEAGYNVEYNDTPKKNIKEINYGIKNDFNFIVIYGENGEEVCVKKNDQSKDQIVPLEKMVATIGNFDDYGFS